MPLAAPAAGAQEHPALARVGETGMKYGFPGQAPCGALRDGAIWQPLPASPPHLELLLKREKE